MRRLRRYSSRIIDRLDEKSRIDLVVREANHLGSVSAPDITVATATLTSSRAACSYSRAALAKPARCKFTTFASSCEVLCTSPWTIRRHRSITSLRTVRTWIFRHVPNADGSSSWAQNLQDSVSAEGPDVVIVLWQGSLDVQSIFGGKDGVAECVYECFSVPLVSAPGRTTREEVCDTLR